MKRLWIAITAAITLFAGITLAHAAGQTQSPAATGGINGKWHFVLDTPGGDRDVDAELTTDNDGKVTGTWGKSAVAGTYKDGQLSLEFQFTSEEAGETAPMKISGKPDGDGILAGTWQFSSYDGTFRAIRPKE